MASLTEGYDTNLFLNQSEANKYLCAICCCIYKEPTSIGCTEDHIFCKKCLDDYFNDNSIKSCPTCRESGLSTHNTKSIKSIGRLVRSLRVKCQLQHEQKQTTENGVSICEWQGDLSDLSAHINIDCPLFTVICEHCNAAQMRYNLNEHIKTCQEKKELCTLQCNKMIKRKLMKNHINNECPMKQLLCDDCKENILRKDMDNHISSICPEFEIYCPFVTYGCSDKIKRKLINAHLQKQEVAHLQMQVKSMERQNMLLQDQLTKVMNGDEHKIFLLLKSKNAYLCDIKSKRKTQENIESFMDKGHNRYCIGRNISYNNAINIGFDAQDIDIFGNNVIFGIKRDRISALCIKTSKCKTFGGDFEFEKYASLYNNDYGLLFIGGRKILNRYIANDGIFNITFNGDSFEQQILTKLPFETVNSAVCVMDERLFVCGGWWNSCNLSTCSVYNFENKQWKQMKNMSHNHQCAAICEWRERGNKIVIAAGHENPDNKYVEEYDVYKDIWMDLPNLNNKHASYAALLTSNNMLFCIGGVRDKDDNLGCIELYDPRDKINKWIYVDTVENYFNLPNDGGAGFNCFLPL